VHARLTLYKRIASARNDDHLRDLQVEMIDRFGLLPEPAKNLIRVTELKLHATPLGIRKIELGPAGGRITFIPQPNIDGMKIIQLIQTQAKVYKLDGQERLRIVMDMPDAESRFELLEGLLKRLGS
jgi:transcription-repair coupling factor (superfamily II helicase)